MPKPLFSRLPQTVTFSKMENNNSGPDLQLLKKSCRIWCWRRKQKNESTPHWHSLLLWCSPDWRTCNLKRWQHTQAFGKDHNRLKAFQELGQRLHENAGRFESVCHWKLTWSTDSLLLFEERLGLCSTDKNNVIPYYNYSWLKNC